MVGSKFLQSAVMRWPSILKLPSEPQTKATGLPPLGSPARSIDQTTSSGVERRAVVPNDAFAHVHPGLGLVLVPAPLGQQAGREREIGVLADVLIEDRAVDRLDGRIDRGRADGRIERRQVDVEGDGQLVARPAPARRRRRSNPDRKLAPPRASAWRRLRSIDHDRPPTFRFTSIVAMTSDRLRALSARLHRRPVAVLRATSTRQMPHALPIHAHHI